MDTSSKPSSLKLKVGAKVGADLTVLGIVDAHSSDPVYLVWHHGGWAPMACKMYRTFQRARREAAVLDNFDHPNIVRYLGMGQPGYVLMEYLDGPTLGSLLRKSPNGRLSQGNALRVAIYLGAALTHIHSRGYLFLDLKPSNVIVHRDRPVLFDVGTVRPIAKNKLESIIGTDDYMAPEQCEGGKVSTATDVFGLGATLYQLLTGQLPYPRGTQRTRFPQTCMEAASLRKYLPRTPGRLNDLLAASLARQPGERPALDSFMLALHELIPSGPRMWPPGFNPVR